MTVADQTVSVTMDGDVGYADPGQPVEFETPDLSGYQLAGNTVKPGAGKAARQTIKEKLKSKNAEKSDGVSLFGVSRVMD